MNRAAARAGMPAPSPRAATERVARRRFAGVALLLAAVGAAATVAGCTGMPATAALPMPGGWMLSMAWMPLCGRGWLDAMAGFLGMWTAMSVAMMTPVAAPALWRYRRAVAAAGGMHPDRQAAWAGAAYLLAWTACGLAVYPSGLALAMAVTRWPTLARAVPFAAVGVVLAAGAMQFSAWKARRLACCRGLAECAAVGAAAAWRKGLRLGLHCVACCANLLAALLALGIMDLRAMAVVTAAIAGERLAPDGPRAARLAGVAVAVAGLWH
ncbi:DUF2182 domain-containing protein [Fulvimonas sp. R45]|uniref:DUF2182 domain-containing protein n=1 Tax=Fulvimonas sp. R45 TaxID=3045937 RepID=UPI00265FE99F|nr:DUF2182 domain-containing protein [Fulvimonas sp. R45]MDO1529852.1 DUF2182 domain-containing protein [Fulvimonas sp. R45]